MNTPLRYIIDYINCIIYTGTRQMSFDSFPLEIVIEIASAAPGTWLALAVAYPPFGSYTLTDAGRADAVRAFGRVETDANGTKRWYLNGRLHRDGGPAIEHPDGTKE